MKKYINFKSILSITLVSTILTGCAQKTGNETYDNNQNAILGTTLGAIVGLILGNNVGGGNKGRNQAIGAIGGAAIGGVVGYSIDKQAQDVAKSLDTNVNNNPQAQMDPSQDLIVSNTPNYVKIMFRDNMMFETNEATPTYSASLKIQKLISALQSYPNTIVQVVGHTDSSGTHEYNQTLSDERASNVGNILFNEGVPNSIFARGCSFDKPIVANDTPQNMALNRRVEIYLYPNQQSVVDVCKQ